MGIIKLIKLLLIGFVLHCSMLFAQDITLWVEDVQTGEEFGLEDGTARVYINMTSTVPVFSYSFTLSGFDNVLSAEGEMEPNCIASQMFGIDNVHVLDNYFYGGGADGNVNIIQEQENAEFLILKATYDSSLDDALLNSYLSPYFLNFNEIVPGVNEGTNFYTFNSETQEIEEIQSIAWIERTWKIGFNETYNAYQQDCSGQVNGIADWDQCSICAGGGTGNEPDYNLDCAGVCFGNAQEDNFDGCCNQLINYWIDTDGDGLGETPYSDQQTCENLGGTIINETCMASACEQPDGFSDNTDDQSVGCVGDYDDCGICGGINFYSIPGDPSSDWNCGNNNTGCPNVDCSGVCGGDTLLDDWYADCDWDGLADGEAATTICGEAFSDIWYSKLNDIVCNDVENGNMIAIDPNNHSWDPHPDCTSNQVDECGSCDGDGYDCRGTCHPNSPLSEDNNCQLDGYGWGLSMIVSIDNPDALSNAPEDIDIHISEGCRPYNGYDSDYEYSYLNGLDICGECYLGNLPQEQVFYSTSDYDFNPSSYYSNYSCSGCADINANNHDPEALFDDGSCNFQLYAGDVNRDGLVNELDLDGIAQFWNYYTDNEREGASIVWFPQFAQDDYWYTPDGSVHDAGCAMFADADGDALVTNGDVSAVLLNWGKEVSSQYYYPWGNTGEAPNCLSYNTVLYEQNYTEMYEYIIENHDYNSETEDAIEYLTQILNVHIPVDINVHQNYPNPFNPKTTFPLELLGSESQDVTLRVYDIKGALVYNQTVNLYPGSYISNSPFTWNAGQEASSGIYLYSFDVPSSGAIAFNKIMLIK